MCVCVIMERERQAIETLKGEGAYLSGVAFQRLSKAIGETPDWGESTHPPIGHPARPAHDLKEAVWELNVMIRRVETLMRIFSLWGEQKGG